MLQFDEMAIQPYADIDFKSGSILGFVSYGERMERKLVNHALVFQLRGLHCSWKQPLAFYSTQSTCPSNILANLIKDIIKIIHDQSCFRVVASFSDQGPIALPLTNLEKTGVMKSMAKKFYIFLNPLIS